MFLQKEYILASKKMKYVVGCLEFFLSKWVHVYTHFFYKEVRLRLSIENSLTDSQIWVLKIP